jgi:hypothetical protein
VLCLVCFSLTPPCQPTANVSMSNAVYSSWKAMYCLQDKVLLERLRPDLILHEVRALPAKSAMLPSMSSCLALRA